MKEQDIQKKIINYLKSIGAYSIKVIQANIAGVSDIVACVPVETQEGTVGRFVAIEVKRRGNKPTKLQEHHLHLVRMSGGKAFVAYDVLDVEIELGDWNVRRKS